MSCIACKVNCREIVKHETKRHVFVKFILVVLVFVGYFWFVASQYGLQDGFLVTALTWSFFVLCTPVADAGFLIDFPLRLLTRIRMFWLEIIVWVIAISLNSYAFFAIPTIYEKTKILLLFRSILEQPFPFWAIILISATGTFVSIQFGDELMDKARHKDRQFYQQHKHKHKFIVMLFLFGIALVLYDFLLKQLGVDLPI